MTNEIKPNTTTLLPLSEYDRVIVSYSGGKDCTAGLLDLLDKGVDPAKIELWHQHIDGEPGSAGLMDWPCTESYCRAIGKALGIKVRFQWRVGGFEGEMSKANARSAPIRFELNDGTVGQAGGLKGTISTRRMFPQVGADLRTRWCSGALKIDVAACAINNDPELKNAKILFVTGERRQESNNRAKYPEFEKHRCSTKSRRVDQWRNVIDFSEADVWEIIRRHRIVPHPAYRLGWGRVSCMACIFGDADQWASVRKIAAERFERIAAYEKDFGKTIHRSLTVIQQADKGNSFIDSMPDWLIKLAMGTEYPVELAKLADGETWEMPTGAFKRCGGPV